ncbi:MAG: hypothetical protein DWI70_04145 [Chloroflexi bacterium]|nr:MAG: hypothetical protein DWI70_04145 [Chloroflexota bacterium]
MMKSNEDGMRRWRIAGGVTAVVLAAVVTLGTTSAAFTATQPVAGLIESGRVELSAGGISSLTFGGADLAAIGPGTTLTESISVSNESTVTLPTEITEIALWADTSGAPADTGGLGSALVVQITRSIGGGPSETIYTGSFDGLTTNDSFSNAIGSVWRSRNGGDLIGSDAREAIYTISLSLPASATEGASSQAGVSLVFEARNATE